MIAEVFQHPAASARARCIKAQLLSRADWQALLSMPDLASVLGALVRTSYSASLTLDPARGAALPFLRAVEHALHVSALQAFVKLARFLHGDSRVFVNVLAQKYELYNIKKALRRLSQPERREHHLATDDYNLGPCALLPGMQWERLTSANELGRALERTYLGEAFRLGLAAFGDAHDLLPFECALEKRYLQELATCARRVAGPDGALLLPLVANYLDEASLAALVRLRFQHGLANEAVFPLLPLEGCARMSEGLFWRVAGARSMDDCCAQLRGEPGWRSLARNTFAETLHALRVERQHLCRRAFVRATPLSLAPVAAFAFAKEQEVRDLITLLQSKRLHVPLEPSRCIRAEAA